MAVQLMTNVKDWSTVTEAGGETMMMGDPKKKYQSNKKNIKSTYCILFHHSCLGNHFLHRNGKTYQQ